MTAQEQIAAGSQARAACAAQRPSYELITPKPETEVLGNVAKQFQFSGFEDEFGRAVLAAHACESNGFTDV
jgi:hypothetical protein